MGYSEVWCQLCGVGFNIGRLRTPEEVRDPPALSAQLLLDLERYTRNARNNAMHRCDQVGDGMEGCTILKHTPPGRPYEEEEHVPGPECTDKSGYHGHRISLKEMHGCCTFQCLIPKTDDWHSQDDDQEFERRGQYFLSGPSDHMPSTDMYDPSTFPERHDSYTPLVSEENVNGRAMPFHTACFEVFKRASLHRTGGIDIHGLVGWFRLEADRIRWSRSSRSEAVRRGQEQWWYHNRGDEHLAANPCFVPGLQDILKKTYTKKPVPDDDWERSVTGAEALAPSQGNGKDRLAVLPCELRLQILAELESPDTGNLCLASPAFRNLPQSIFRSILLRTRPWLWEAWCTLPYSFWATTTSSFLEAQNERFSEAYNAFNDAADALFEDDDIDLTDSQEQEILSLKVQAAEALDGMNAWQKDVDVVALPPAQTDWRGIFIETESRQAEILGLANRKRIWTDCEAILDQIEKYWREGAIQPATEWPESEWTDTESGSELESESESESGSESTQSPRSSDEGSNEGSGA
ncbi:Putative F-box-like domain superfamily protein [Colletotrichum destructivum]|uniref:F-box-like domain superfamily protein n=1 Tax=Colletotrichum destructivum TaxID=34406 RepID=A0AAX4IJR7_9PEZI|nr:Putative F-box-like domain superfamily protein [Colletotrichum destructivum]